jgi:hypothetical protein
MMETPNVNANANASNDANVYVTKEQQKVQRSPLKPPMRAQVTDRPATKMPKKNAFSSTPHKLLIHGHWRAIRQFETLVHKVGVFFLLGSFTRAAKWCAHGTCLQR